VAVGCGVSASGEDNVFIASAPGEFEKRNGVASIRGTPKRYLSEYSAVDIFLKKFNQKS
jgi:hypothetical protein